MKRIVLGTIIALMLSAPLLGTTRVDLDRDWSFRMDPEQIGETAQWQNHPPPNTESVNLPHTWNIGGHDGYLGKAWYFTTFEMPVPSADLHARLYFGATFYSARVWLNGVELGSHEGGYTAYSFDVTRQLQSTNYIAVEIDNRVGAATIPGLAQRSSDHAWYDWWDYGGIVRDVWLTMGGPIQVRRQQIRSRITNDVALVEDKIFLEDHLAPKPNVSVRMTALGPHGETAGAETREVALASEDNAIDLSLKIPSPQLWGIDHPNVYRMQVQVIDSQGHVVDQQSDTFGIRTIEIRDRHLLINGERVRLTGVTRHEDSMWEGLAETPGTMRSRL